MREDDNILKKYKGQIAEAAALFSTKKEEGPTHAWQLADTSPSMGSPEESPMFNSTPSELTEEDEVKAVAEQIRILEGDKPFAITDQKCGELLGKCFKSSSRYNTSARSWDWNNGRQWTRDPEGMHIERSASIFSKALYYHSLFNINANERAEESKLIEFRRECGALTRRSRRIAAIQDARQICPVSNADYDRNEALFNVDNGVLNLETGEFTPHDPDLLLSKKAGCAYLPDVSDNVFAEFVNQIMQGDEEKIRFLQTYCGYALIGRPIEECFLILYGPSTRNGKTTFVDVIASVFGDYAVTLEPESLVRKKFANGSGPTDDIARLAGKRLVVSSEFPKNMKIDESLLKKITGNNILRARHLNEAFFDFKAMFSIIMDANYLPVVTDPTLFTSGRVMVLPFERHFSDEEQDRGLKMRLQQPENLSAALNWMLEGLRRYKAEGLRRPDSVVHATEQYAEDSDKIGRFVSEELEKASTNIKASDVYQRFVAWCRRSGLGSESKQNFFQLLRSRNLLQKTGTVMGKTEYNVLIGFKLVGSGSDYYYESSDEYHIVPNDEDLPFD